MTTPGCMALLAQHRHPLRQHSVVIAPVRVMAIQAILFDRRMFVHIWTSFFGVTLITELVDGIGPQHLIIKLTMRVMTVNACHFALLDGMVGLFVYHSLDVPVALEADLGLFSFQEFISPFVGRMAIVAGNILHFMLAGIPESLVLHNFMAGKTLCCLGLWISFFVKGKDIYAPAAAFLNMLCTWTVAGLAGILRCRPLHMFLGMDGLCIRRILGLVTALTGFSADETFFFHRSFLCFLFTAPGHGDKGE